MTLLLFRCSSLGWVVPGSKAATQQRLRPRRLSGECRSFSVNLQPRFHLNHRTWCFCTWLLWVWQIVATFTLRGGGGEKGEWKSVSDKVLNRLFSSTNRVGRNLIFTSWQGAHGIFSPTKAKILDSLGYPRIVALGRNICMLSRFVQNEARGWRHWRCPQKDQTVCCLNIDLGYPTSDCAPFTEYHPRFASLSRPPSEKFHRLVSWTTSTRRPRRDWSLRSSWIPSSPAHTRPKRLSEEDHTFLTKTNEWLVCDSLDLCVAVRDQ